MELYAERGFENTTVAEIAERAGLTERTFFRHFADKREVLFSGAGAFQEALVGAVAAGAGCVGAAGGGAGRPRRRGRAAPGARVRAHAARRSSQRIRSSRSAS